MRQVDYRELPEDLGITADDYVCVMTRGHHGDYDVQRQILPIRPHYLGVIGSRRKLAFVKGKLLADGFPKPISTPAMVPSGLPFLLKRRRKSPLVLPLN